MEKNNQWWHAQIRVNKNLKDLGYYDNDYDAAMKYDEEAIKHREPVSFPSNLEGIQAKKKTREISANKRDTIN